MSVPGIECLSWRIILLVAALAAGSWAAQTPAEAEYRRRVREVTRTRGFVALWDFVKREDGAAGQGRFDAHKGKGESHDFRLDAMNYVRDYWARAGGPLCRYSAAGQGSVWSGD